MVLGPHTRLVQHLGAGRDRGVEERAHRVAVGRDERDVDSRTNPRPWSRPDPEEAGGHAVTDDGAEVHDPYPAERRQHRVVERAVASTSAHGSRDGRACTSLRDRCRPARGRWSVHTVREPQQDDRHRAEPDEGNDRADERASARRREEARAGRPR